MGVDLSGAVRRFLERPNLAVLATIGASGAPQATPVWFMVEDGRILINTSRGRAKLANMRRNPRVAVTIVDRDDPYTWVQIRGRVVAFDREHGARDIDRLSLRYRNRHYVYPPTDRPEHRVTVLIEPEGITGNPG